MIVVILVNILVMDAFWSILNNSNVSSHSSLDFKLNFKVEGIVYTRGCDLIGQWAVGMISLHDMFYIHAFFVKFITLNYAMENGSAMHFFSFHLKYYLSNNQIQIAW